MSVAKVLRLDEYRDRRTHRLRLAEALHRPDGHKRSILAHLVEVAELSGADRVATVWLEEYGNGLIHPHVVLDHSSDRPRRAFSSEPLCEAWELGVPGAHDRPAEPASRLPATLAVALGSDGTRAWFLVAESVYARSSLDTRARDRIMFLAGECAGILLHRDLDLMVRGGRPGVASFAGWRILEDLDGREPDEHESRRVAQRFVVGRLARMLADEDLVVAPERAADQVRRARAELRNDLPTDDAEVLRWHRVLDALERGEHEALASELVQLADAVEAMGHSSGALELYRCAYDIAAAIGVPDAAADAARYSGRTLRRRAQWEEARGWFEVAHEIAGAAGMPDKAARALVGLAGIKREVGNLPAAREGFRHALALAEASGDRNVVGLAHHALLGLEQQAGDFRVALDHGWLALASYESEEERLRCMAGLGGALLEYGDRDAAEDAWTLVVHSTTERYYRIYAHDALGHICALRGDRVGFQHHTGLCDALGWETTAESAKAEILYYRGLSYLALEEPALARSWLVRAVQFAEAEGFNRVLIKAERALEGLGAADRAAARTAVPAAPREVREGLRAMRQELAASGV